MNGHSRAEASAFNILAIRRRVERLIGDGDDTPIFIFASGPGTGEHVLQHRIPCDFRDGRILDVPMLSALISQLTRVVHAASGDAAQDGGALPRDCNDVYLSVVATAQATFLRRLLARKREDKSGGRWGLMQNVLSGDYALYFKLLFPQAKFVFLHRNPIDAFRAFLSSAGTRTGTAQRDIRWANAFADDWARLVASFELWHREVDGLLVSYDAATARDAGEIESYLGERVAEVMERTDEEGLAVSSDESLREEEVTLLIERTEGIAARCGYTLEQRPAASLRQAAAPEELTGRMPRVQAQKARMSCAVLVAATRYIEPECDQALAELERRGYTVTRLRGCPAIDQGRNQLATAALDAGFDETLWIDADTGFDPDAVERIRAHALPVVAGICARKQPRAGLAVAPIPGSRELVMGEGGGLVEVLYAGTGFMLVRREVYLTIQRRFSLPVCDEEKARAIPFFMPMLEEWGGRMSYLGEDYAFSRRARLCGYKIMADTSIRLWHIGMYRYGYEDAGNEVPRVASYRHVFESEQQRHA